LKPQYGFIEIDKLDNIIKLPLREGREWEHHDAEDPHEHNHDHGDFDPHLWLSTHNAQAIVTTTAKHLAQVDPQHAQQYQAN
ncbi:MAG TPA: zinc ABC transporter substrate-binding protein, partial [Candidatus Berkiella sp.]|nr:zinc ABC transporter substrate-binding protein [Candidatus Berkiella sp.]